MIPYDYLIAKTNAIVTSYAEQLPLTGVGAVYRLTGGVTVKSLGKVRKYTTHTFNCIIRGEQDSDEIVSIGEDMIEALDMNQDGVIITLVTSELQYAYTDDNGNLNYTFNVSVKL